jgi:hypothetical protein
MYIIVCHHLTCLIRVTSLHFSTGSSPRPEILQKRQGEVGDNWYFRNAQSNTKFSSRDDRDMTPNRTRPYLSVDLYVNDLTKLLAESRDDRYKASRNIRSKKNVNRMLYKRSKVIQMLDCLRRKGKGNSN